MTNADEIVKVLGSLTLFFGALAGGVAAMRKAFPPRSDITAKAVQSVTDDLKEARKETEALKGEARQLRTEIAELRKAANTYSDYVHDLRQWIVSGQGPPPPDYPEGLRA